MDYQYIIKEKYQNMINEIVWNIGANISTSPYGLSTLEQYNAERGTITYQNSRQTTWNGKIGLIYASDYGYASTNEECRTNLRAGLTLTDNKIDATGTKCKNNN